jgi:transposase-like protein
MDAGPSVKTRSSSMQSASSSSFDLKTLTARQLALSTANEDLAISFAIQLGLISKVPGKCPNCDNIMDLSKEFKSKFGMILSCKCKKTISLSTNTIFQNSALEFWQILSLIYHFCNLDEVSKAARQCKVTVETACQWYYKLRFIQSTIVFNLDDQKIGGEDHVVEMDEFHLYTPKHHKGRDPAKSAVWGFGGIDVNTRDIFVVPVVQRNKQTLLPLIKQYVHPGSSIFTDMWGAYRNLEKDLAEMKIIHRSVNHKIEFVNSNDPEVHTQTVERLWLKFRSVIPKFTNMSQTESYFSLFLYLVKFEWIKRHPGDRFRLFCKHIAEVHPGPFKTGKKIE